MNTISILILDDVPYVRQLIANEVSGLQGIKDIHEAGNAPGAVSALKECHPEIVILDINVPGGTTDGIYFANGIDVLRAAKQYLPTSTMIMLTNNSNDFYRRECKKAGADFFFDKTNEFDTFLDQLQYLISDPNE